MQNSKRHIRIAVDGHSSVHACVVEPIPDKARPLIFVFSHGFSVDGTESRRIFISLSEILSLHGFSSILFDYRGSGYSDLAFEEMTFDSEMADLQAVIKFAKEEFPQSRVVLWGVSFGAAVAAHVAECRSDLDFMILWCLSAELYSRYENRLGPQIKEQGYTYIDKGFRVNLSFLESLKGRDTYRAIKKSGVPCLLIHGTADNIASVELSRKAHCEAPENTILHEIEGGNHGFKLQPDLYDHAKQITLDWIDRNARR